MYTLTTRTKVLLLCQQYNKPLFVLPLTTSIKIVIVSSKLVNCKLRLINQFHI